MLIFRCVVCGIIIYKPVFIYCTSGVHNFTKSSIPNSIPWTLLKALCPFFLCFLTKVDLTILFICLLGSQFRTFFCSFFFIQQKTLLSLFIRIKKDTNALFRLFFLLLFVHGKKLQKIATGKSYKIKNSHAIKFDILGCIGCFDSNPL